MQPRDSQEQGATVTSKTEGTHKRWHCYCGITWEAREKERPRGRVPWGIHAQGRWDYPVGLSRGAVQEQLTPKRTNIARDIPTKQGETRGTVLISPSSSSALSLHRLVLVHPTQKQAGQRVWAIYFVLHGKDEDQISEQIGKWATRPPSPWKFPPNWSPGTYPCLSPILSLHWALYKSIFIASTLQQLSMACRNPPAWSTGPCVGLPLPTCPAAFQATFPLNPTPSAIS